ncbi:hypothetical protein GX51_02637 [Blastomyces parvus]|uniref:Indole-diterpene biosynthesis protein PaxU n=1 Tax=Blastomyces parvus TaxID=2060905 RepID=A0A2B7XAB7_9EURO|nr:hypothetical protein GX51_02637 [Blastomyces parvus]
MAPTTASTSSGSSPEGSDDVFASLTKLSPLIYLREKPPLASSSPELPPPTICLLFWMDAAPRHAAKFVNKYITALPNARIICMGTISKDVLLRGSQKSHRLRVAPFVTALRASDGPIHFHVFSNGGMYSLYQIATEYRSRVGKPIPIKSLIVDSAPGQHGLTTAARAFSYALPRFFIIRMVGACVIWTILIAHWLVSKLGRKGNAFDNAMIELNDPALIDVKAKRLYIYSKTDELVQWKHVEAHVAQAIATGWQVSTAVFKSPHVGHMRADPDRYWKLVWELIPRDVIQSG